MHDAQPHPGLVSLVGAGPGDPDLLTLKGRQRLAEADVVIYDYLAPPALLEHCRPEAERIYVGKQAGRHTLTQEQINALLIEHARAGRRVVRLKGGDPYVFGRGGEEAEALQAAGVPWEVVPGVTAGVAVPAYAGIPVTHRALASSVAFVTGHEDPTKPESAIDWSRLATAVDTLVLYMGVGNLAAIAAQLIAHGRAPDTPVAVIRWGTTPEQTTVTATLATVAEAVARAGLKPPALTVIGEVVRLRERLRWFDAAPLWGRRVIVTRARDQASALIERLRALGAQPIEYPVIAFAPPEDWAPLDAALRRLETYDWVIFTSANGVRFTLERMAALGIAPAALARCRLGAIGPATAAALAQAGLRADFVPSAFVAEAVVAEIDDVRGRRMLLPRADIAREALVEGLSARGAVVEQVVAYRTVLHAEAADAAEDAVVALLRAGAIDAITFTSSSTVTNFLERLARSGVTPDEARRLLTGPVVAAIGPITAQRARAAGLPVTVVAERYTLDGLLEALLTAMGASRAEVSL